MTGVVTWRGSSPTGARAAVGAAGAREARSQRPRGGRLMTRCSPTPRRVARRGARGPLPSIAAGGGGPSPAPPRGPPPPRAPRAAPPGPPATTPALAAALEEVCRVATEEAADRSIPVEARLERT